MQTIDLECWADTEGNLHLDYFDAHAGKDRYFVVKVDGSAYEIDYGDDEQETLTPVDIFVALRGLTQP